MPNKRPCPLCYSSNLKRFINKYVLCNSCGCIFNNETDNLQGRYEEEYYFFDEHNKASNVKRAVWQIDFAKRLIEKYRLPTQLRTLDIGSGTGEFVAKCLGCEYDAYGVDISQFCVEAAIQRWDIPGRVFCIKDVSLISSIIGNSFEVITLWEILEHLEDPIDFLQRVSLLLKKGGLLVFSTPNVKSLWAKMLKEKWHGFEIPEYHITYFESRTLNLAIEKAGNYKNTNIFTVAPYAGTLFLTKNVLEAIVPQQRSAHMRKALKLSVFPLIFVPNKLLELFAPRFEFADTLAGYAFRK